MPPLQTRFGAQLAALRARGLPPDAIRQALRLPLAEAERLGLASAPPWSHLAWRIAANRARWRRRGEGADKGRRTNKSRAGGSGEGGR